MELYPERTEEFRRALTAAGFERADAGPLEAWKGPIIARWSDPDTGEERTAEHRVQVVLCPGFPIRQPSVFPESGSAPDLEVRHRAPVEGGALCLWPETDRRGSAKGWHPSLTPEEFLDRIVEWFGRYHLDDWGPEDRPPDLHLSFRRPDTVELMLISDDWAPPVGEESGRFGVWDKQDARFAFAGHPVAGAADVPRAHEDRIFGVLGLMKGRFTRAGAWFRLRREPRPRHNLQTLLEEIDEASGHDPGWAVGRLRRLFDKPPYKAMTIVIALGYPATEGGREGWLFLRVKPLGLKPLKFGRASDLDRHIVFAYETAPCGRGDLMRRTGHVAENLTGKRVLILGVGAVGSVVAMLLAKAGVPFLRLVDGDRVRPTNAVRHEAGLGSIGFDKTIATWWAIHQHVPDCVVHLEQATWDLDRLAAWMREADVIVDATAHENFSMLVNEVALREGKLAIYAFTRRRAAVGEVLIVRPGSDPCIICHTQLAERPDYPVVPSGDEGEFVETGCGVPTVQASAVDVESTAVFTARTVLRLLQARADDRNHFVLVNEPLPDASGALATEGLHAFTWPQVACSACGGGQL